MFSVSLLAKPQCWLITRNCAKMWFLHKDSEQHPLADWCFRPLLTKALISLAGVQEAFFCSCLWILACSHHIKGWTNVSIVVKCARWPRESVFAWEESCSELLKVMSSTLPESDYHSVFFPIPHSKPGAKIDSKPYTPRFLLHVPWMPWSNFNFFCCLWVQHKEKQSHSASVKAFSSEKSAGLLPKILFTHLQGSALVLASKR